MSKIDLDPITSGYNLSKINANFQKVEDELNNKVLYRNSPTGEPNSMSSNLDMNGNKILNVVTGTSPSDLATRGYVDEEIAEERIYVDQQLYLVNSELDTKYYKTGGPVFGDINLNGHKLIGASEVQTSKTSTSILEINGVPVIPGNSVIDPYNGTREALRRSYAEAGYNLVDGSFEVGGTLVNANDVLLQERTGKAFSGPAGYVAAGTDPVSGGFVDKSGGLLRHELSNVEERLLGVGAKIYRGSNGQYVQNGDTVPAGTTHLAVLISGKVENVAMSPIASGVVSGLSEVSAVVGATNVYFARGDHVSDWGIYPHNTPTENSDAFEFMLANKPRIGTGTSQSIGNVIFNGGEYQFENPWELKVHAIFEGVSSGHNGVSAWTAISFSGNDDNAITVNRYNTLNGGVETVPSGRADGTEFRNLTIKSRTSVAYKSGVWFRARSVLRGCQIVGFGGWGLRIVATAVTSDNSVLGNANNWILDGCVIAGNGTAGAYPTGGMFVDGADVNIGSAKDVDISSNYGYGLFESSFLGNTYVACHFATNGKASGNGASQVSHNGIRYYLVDTSDGIGALTEPGTDNDVWRFYGAGGVHSTYPAWSDSGDYSVGLGIFSDNANARNEFFGCYTEGGQPRPKLQAPDKVWGGIMSGGGAGFDEDSNGLVFGATTNGLLLSPAISVLGALSKVIIGGSLGVNQYALGLFEDGGVPNGITMQNRSGQWGWSYANQGLIHGFYTDTTTETAGRAVPVAPNTPFMNVCILGSGSAKRHFGRAYWTTGTSFPTSGEFAKGDTYFFSGTNAGGHIGCACTVSGTAGSTAVFKYFGAIDV